jgi:MFS family permease
VARQSALMRVLAQREPRIYFGGSLASWTGLWTQRVAVDWLAWEMTHSPLWVGTLAFCNLGPSVIVSPLAGAVADRLDRVRLTMVTQIVTALHAATLAALVLTGLARIELIAMLEVLAGATQAFGQPARQSLVAALVPRADLPGAVALNSLCFNLARSIGPGIGGLLVASVGVVPAMVVNCCGFLLASASMPLLRLDPAQRRGHAPTGSVLSETLDGLRYVAGHRGMLPLFLFAASIGVLVRAVPEMLPPFVDQLFHQGPKGLATVSSTIGMAALCGAIAVAARGQLSGLCRLAIGSGFALAVGTAAFVATPSFPLAVGCAALIGAASTMHGIAVQTLLQSATAGHMTGRVLSLWGMITRAAPALGALTYGYVSEAMGLRLPVLAGCVLAGLAGLAAIAGHGRMAGALERA